MISSFCYLNKNILAFNEVFMYNDKLFEERCKLLLTLASSGSNKSKNIATALSHIFKEKKNG